MPIVMGAGVSYSPLIYRERDRWPAIAAHLRGTATQPRSAQDEDGAILDGYESRIAAGLSALKDTIASAGLDALILLTADRGSQFDPSHVPQIHIQSGGRVFGDTALTALGEAPRPMEFTCDSPTSSLFLEELVRRGYDIAEGKDAFKPVGDPVQGAAAAAVEAVGALAPGLPIVPVNLNCHVRPLIAGRRLHGFGTALAEVAALTPARLGVLVSGGLSGDPGGPMSGWVDDVFDGWVLSRIEKGRSADLIPVWDVPSRNLLQGTAEVRLWMTAAAALEHAGGRARTHDYMPIHHAAAGVAFVSWEN